MTKVQNCILKMEMHMVVSLTSCTMSIISVNILTCISGLGCRTTKK